MGSKMFLFRIPSKIKGSYESFLILHLFKNKALFISVIFLSIFILNIFEKFILCFFEKAFTFVNPRLYLQHRFC